MSKQFEIVRTIKIKDLPPRVQPALDLTPVVRAVATLEGAEVLQLRVEKNYVVTRLREVLKESFKASTYTVKQRKGEKGGIDVYIMRDATGGAK